MNNLQDFQSFNEGLKDKLARRWDKFKDELHPWDFSRDEWNAKWGTEKTMDEWLLGKPKKGGNKIDPYNEEDWGVPKNPYTIAEFNAMLRNGEIKRCIEGEADFVWIYKNGNIVFFKKVV